MLCILFTERKCFPLRKWISIALIGTVVLMGCIFWKNWLPAAAAFSLRQYYAPPSLQSVGLFLLKNTDPMMKNVGRFLALETEEALDEPFLFFMEEEKPKKEAVEDDSVQAANLSAISGIYTEFDGTAVANATDYDITENLNETVKMPTFTPKKPAVLIYHTHTTECYRNDEGITNTEDESKNVVAVGEAMKAVFEEAGYQTIHVKTIFNRDFSNAYPNARAAINEIMEENPSIQVVLDVHRDSISSNGVDYYPVTEVDGKEAAQVMLVCGTDSKGLSHPNWRRNFTYALQLSRKMGSMYGELSRPVNLRRDRFNTHYTDHTLLVEVGSSANTLEQAIYGGELTARAMIALWKTS